MKMRNESQRAIKSQLLALRRAGKLTLAQYVVADELLLRDEDTPHNDAALARLCRVSRPTIQRTRDVLQEVGLLPRASE
jgi:hypothetical protein